MTSSFSHALSYAAWLHNGQVRKGSNTPYISHLLAVAALVIEDGGDEEEAIAALLHDALEDQPELTSAAEIQKRFGRRVRELVEGCTDTPAGWAGGVKPAWRERKEAYLAHLRTSPSNLRISLADKLHNAGCILRDMEQVGDAVWERFAGGKDGTLWYYAELASAFRVAGCSGHMMNELERIVDYLGFLNAIHTKARAEFSAPGPLVAHG